MPAVCEPDRDLRVGFVPSDAAIKNIPLEMRGIFFMAAELGFEPRHTESESAVLPLHNSAILKFHLHRFSIPQAE